MIHSARPGDWAHRKELQRIGIEKEKKAGKFKGAKPRIDYDEVKRLWDLGVGATSIAKHLGIDRTSVYRILGDVAKEPYKKNKNGQYLLPITLRSK